MLLESELSLLLLDLLQGLAFFLVLLGVLFELIPLDGPLELPQLLQDELPLLQFLAFKGLLEPAFHLQVEGEIPSVGGDTSFRPGLEALFSLGFHGLHFKSDVVSSLFNCKLFALFFRFAFLLYLF